MAHQNPSDSDIRELLTSLRTVAMAGASDKQNRPVYGVSQFLNAHGIRTIPVNPRLAGKTVLGETCYATLAELPEPVDMVDCFINSQRVGAIVDAAIAIRAPAVWLQLNVIDEAAAARAAEAGLVVVMDRCPAIEWPRLGLE
jgi:predicted CoA-binding protein